MKLLTGVLTLSVAAAAAAAAAPPPKDFAYGLAIEPEPGRPVQQFTVPERVYQGVTRADLGDLRVFNSAGGVVPHALCTTPEQAPATVREQPLPVFPLHQGRPPPLPTGGGRVNVQTPSGMSVQVIEGGTLAAGAVVATPDAPQTFVVDATAVPHPLRSLQLAWSTPDGASEAQVRLEASDDLNHWRTVVAGTTLLRVAADGRTLDRNHIDLPEGRYRYLRLARSDGSAVRIEGVSAQVVQPAAPAQPFWFAAGPAPAESAAEFWFDSGRLAPVEAASVEPASPNMALRVALESRRAADQPWQGRWTGEVSSVSGGVREPAPEAVAFGIEEVSIRFAAVTDTLWRVRVLRGAETLGGGRPTLRLGYHPARLRFLAQGDGPYLVAYGSARAPRAEAPGCDALLAAFAPEQRAAMIGNAQVSAAPAGLVGGPEALTPPPRPTPVRQIVLWAVLLLGTAALVAMAISLLRRLRKEVESP